MTSVDKGNANMSNFYCFILFTSAYLLNSVKLNSFDMINPVTEHNISSYLYRICNCSISKHNEFVDCSSKSPKIPLK